LAKVTSFRQKRARRELRIVAATIVACLALAFAVFAGVFGPAYHAYFTYAPCEGDILFQSLPRNRLVNAIEGATNSPYSHCGIVSKQNGNWLVYEALDGVEATPLKDFIFRGRNYGFAVFRLKPVYQSHIPKTVENVKSYLGRPYDVRYRMDDEKIYCTELIFKAYKDAAGKPLGNLVRLGDLNWRPFRDTIQHFEGGPVPLDREMITPKHMADARQLHPVFNYGISVTDQ